MGLEHQHAEEVPECHSNLLDALRLFGKALFSEGLDTVLHSAKASFAESLREQCKWSAPRTCWTYGPESFMSVVKRIAASCDRGTAAWQVPLKVCSKFALAHHLILKGWMDLADDE